MAKTFFILAMAAASICLVQSCEKLDFRSTPPAPITKNNTIAVSIKQDAAYSYSVTAISPFCTSGITTNPAHAGTNKLVTDADGDGVYSYVPAPGYSGPDQVVITMTGAQNNGTNMNTDGTETDITTINITVEAK